MPVYNSSGDVTVLPSLEDFKRAEENAVSGGRNVSGVTLNKPEQPFRNYI